MWPYRKIRVCVWKKGGWPTFMWRHKQVNCLLWKAGPNSAYLPLQICIIQTLHQNPWRNTSKHVTSNLLQRDGCHSYSYGSLQGFRDFVHSLSYQMPIWSRGPCESGPSVWRWSALCCHLQWACSSSPSAGRKESKEDRPMNQKQHINSSRKRGWGMTAFTRQGSKWSLQVLKFVQSAIFINPKTF